MQNSYTSNFLKIYFWQGISILLNFLSLFIVTPKLTSQPVIYGTYMVCISAMIFLSYADLGFVSACFKYASEYFGAEDKKSEVKVTAFGAFILFIFVCFISLGFIFLSFYPEWLFSNIKSAEEIKVASALFLILSLFSFNIVFQRILQVIFGVRLEDYAYQRINIVLSLIKILSVLYFFRKGHYDIVGYFLFTQAVGVVGSFIGFFVARKRYSYDLLFLIKNFKFSKEQFDHSKSLAFSSLYLTILWILYYELDSFAIARLLGAEYVAYFAIGFTLMSVFRTIFGTVYTPFAARFNHFIGTNDHEGLKSFYLNVIMITLPIVLFPVITLVILMKPFILCWIGSQYTSSILVATLLMCSYLFSYISYPAGMLMTALVKIKQMYVINTIIALVYWVGITLTIRELNIVSFGLFKLVAFLAAGLYYIGFSLKVTDLSLTSFFSRVFKPALLPSLVMIVILFVARFYLPAEKDKINLILVIFVGIVSTGVGLIIYFFTSISFKGYVMELKNKYIN